MKRLFAAIVALCVTAVSPAHAMPGKTLTVLAKRKGARSRRDPSATTPQRAEASREAARRTVAADLQAGAHERAANMLAQAARDLADPLLFIESAEACLVGAAEAMDPTLVDVGMERARIALDMLHFQRGSKTRWVVVEPTWISSLVDRANTVLRRGEELGNEISSIMIGAAREASLDERRASRFVTVGSVLTGLGVAGAATGITGLGLGAMRQQEAEALDLDAPGAISELDDLDQAGRRANIVAYVGGALALVGVTVGVALIIRGKKKQRKSGTPVGATLRISPTPSGMILMGRF